MSGYMTLRQGQVGLLTFGCLQMRAQSLFPGVKQHNHYRACPDIETIKAKQPVEQAQFNMYVTGYLQVHLNKFEYCDKLINFNN